ncbi:hypothetical protein ARALYDRAFT_918309 [Arabidopsis lyrata subsp. lyrata]|uniref:Uncharacterized protein n=1 Tax=Arabidopsis lyrata subsp. lyrata TaxID=81972 RepID=D7MS65_ARALL|nr:hypothetical protein ARALYDRAFT_918309 [Arabidopsis lyrata subsp. lyrata]
MWKRESSDEESSQSHENLEAQRSSLPSVQSSSPHMFLPSASAPEEPLNFSQVLTGVRELDLVPNRNSSHSYENPMFLPPPPMFLPHAPLLYPLSSLNSWSRAESGRAQQFRSRESIFYPYKEEQILSSEEELFGKVGLHCYNLQHVKISFFSLGPLMNFCLSLLLVLYIIQVVVILVELSSIISYAVTLEAVDPMRPRNSSCQFETLARHAIENKDCLSAIVTECRIKPQNPDSEERRGNNPFNKALVDDFFKGKMPDWMPEGALTGSNKLQYYEKTIQPVKPLELRKIVVRTKEDVESKKKVKAENAIFYISFKNCCGRDYNVIVRRTTDGIPEHFSLEVKCC